MASLPMMSYEDAKGYLKEAIDQRDGGLFDETNYLAWTPGDKEATLDGKFSAKELWAIAVYMMEWEAQS